MSDIRKVRCPECDATMNHHAVKIEYGPDEPGSPGFEGVLKDVYTCTECGAVEMITAN